MILQIRELWRVLLLWCRHKFICIALFQDLNSFVSPYSYHCLLAVYLPTLHQNQKVCSGILGIDLPWMSAPAQKTSVELRCLTEAFFLATSFFFFFFLQADLAPFCPPKTGTSGRLCWFVTISLCSCSVSHFDPIRNEALILQPLILHSSSVYKPFLGFIWLGKFSSKLQLLTRIPGSS